MQVLSTGKLNLYIFNSLHPGIFLTFSFPFYQECGDTMTTFSKHLTVSNNQQHRHQRAPGGYSGGHRPDLHL